jgi:hypothetical protein
LLLYNYIKYEKSKKVAMQWAKEKKKNDNKTLKKVEESLESHYNNEGFGFLTKE